MRATADGRPELVNNLLLSGALANAKNKSGNRPLHYAVKGGHLGVVKLLLKAGASPSSRRKVRWRRWQRWQRAAAFGSIKNEQFFFFFRRRGNVNQAHGKQLHDK